ncbi:helix-turn-helix transcriptional regulator [Microvirga terricola]|uniref:HTH luxR-type domain-containing protein n=1 Tax=Microvirga terricola TaxID=2719797 RepID=A0ABX0VCE6_9HYPH|nr:helix-turn-helix transcriptional regulator [Microvirga terricola]NIX76036.1 hypothetical protein [Microvirga terricola]
MTVRPAISDLIELIYKAAVDPDGWGAVVSCMAEIFGGTGSLFVHDAASSNLVMEVSDGFDQSYIDSFKAYYGATNPLLFGALNAPDSKVSRMFDLTSKAVLDNSEYFIDWLHPQRLYHCIGTRFSIDHSVSMFATFHRATGDRDFNEREMNDLAQLVPHLRRAVDISTRLSQQPVLSPITKSTLGELSIAAFLLSRDGAVGDMNAEAHRLLAEGAFLKLQLERLVPSELQSVAAFRNALKQVVDGKAAEIVALRSSHGEVMRGTIVPVPMSNFWLGGMQQQALFTVKAPGAKRVQTADFMQKAFQLTFAEARLLEALAAGETIAQFCARHQISRNTAKTHLQNLFQKTGTSRQAALVRLAHQASDI